MENSPETKKKALYTLFLEKFGFLLAVVMSCFQLYTAAFGSFEGILQRSIHLGFASAIILLMFPLL